MATKVKDGSEKEKSDQDKKRHAEIARELIDEMRDVLADEGVTNPSYSDIAERLGISEHTIKHWAIGARRIDRADIKIVRRIAALLGKSPVQVLFQTQALEPADLLPPDINEGFRRRVEREYDRLLARPEYGFLSPRASFQSKLLAVRALSYDPSLINL